MFELVKAKTMQTPKIGRITSKGSNAVISYIDNFPDEFGLGEPDGHFHCHNCSGQN